MEKLHPHKNSHESLEVMNRFHQTNTGEGMKPKRGRPKTSKD